MRSGGARYSPVFISNFMSVDPAALDWANRETKRNNDKLVREILAEKLINKKKDLVKCLSFPADRWLWEQSLAEAFPKNRFEVYGTEQNPKVFAKMKSVRRLLHQLYGNLRLYCAPEPQTFRDAIKTLMPGGGFDIVYPDYMGTWSRSKRDELNQMFERGFLAPDGFLFFTLALNRGRPESLAELRAYAAGDFDITIVDNREIRTKRPRRVEVPKLRGIPALVVDLAAKHGVTLRAHPVHVYYNLNEYNSTPEALFIFQRIA